MDAEVTSYRLVLFGRFELFRWEAQQEIVFEDEEVIFRSEEPEDP